MAYAENLLSKFIFIGGGVVVLVLFVVVYLGEFQLQAFNTCCYYSACVAFEKLFFLLLISSEKYNIIYDIFNEALNVNYNSFGPTSFNASEKSESCLRLVNSFVERFILLSRSNYHSPLSFTDTSMHSDSPCYLTSTFTSFRSSKQENKLNMTYRINP